MIDQNEETDDLIVLRAENDRLKAELDEKDAAIDWAGEHCYQMAQGGDDDEVAFVVVVRSEYGGDPRQIGDEKPTPHEALFATYADSKGESG